MQSTIGPPRYDTRGVEIRSQRDTVIASLLHCPEQSGHAKDARAAQRRVLPPGPRGTSGVPATTVEKGR